MPPPRSDIYAADFYLLLGSGVLSLHTRPGHNNTAQTYVKKYPRWYPPQETPCPSMVHHPCRQTPPLPPHACPLLMHGAAREVAGEPRRGRAPPPPPCAVSPTRALSASDA
eukprot:617703-Prymnesium_polylepis.1